MASCVCEQIKRNLLPKEPEGMIKKTDNGIVVIFNDYYKPYEHTYAAMIKSGFIMQKIYVEHDVKSYYYFADGTVTDVEGFVHKCYGG